MPKTNTDIITLIKRSVLLSPENKEALLKVAENLNKENDQTLRSILNSEEKVLQNITHHAIEVAIDEGDEKFLQELDTLINSSLMTLRETEETGEKSKELKEAERLFGNESL